MQRSRNAIQTNLHIMNTGEQGTSTCNKLQAHTRTHTAICTYMQMKSTELCVDGQTVNRSVVYGCRLSVVGWVNAAASTIIADHVTTSTDSKRIGFLIHFMHFVIAPTSSCTTCAGPVWLRYFCICCVWHGACCMRTKYMHISAIILVRGKHVRRKNLIDLLAPAFICVRACVCVFLDDLQLFSH